MSIHSAMPRHSPAAAAPTPEIARGTSKRERILRPSQQEVADYLNMLRKIVEHGQSEGSFRRNLHPQLVAKAIFGVLDEMVTSWMLSEKDYDLGASAEPVADLLLTGLL